MKNWGFECSKSNFTAFLYVFQQERKCWLFIVIETNFVYNKVSFGTVESGKSSKTYLSIKKGFTTWIVNENIYMHACSNF